jgi:hypothetical protein
MTTSNTASQNNEADYDRGFAAGVTAGLKLKSIGNTEEQKALEMVCERLEALETKFRKQESTRVTSESARQRKENKREEAKRAK